VSRSIVTDISAIEQRPQAASLGGMPLISEATAGDYIALMKPRVMALVVFTALVGLMLAPVHVHPVIGFTALLAIAVGAGAAGVLNMWYDADIDAIMSRTSGRPIPRGKVTPGEALGFGMTLATGAIVVLGLLVNWLAAAMLAFTIVFYVVIYTMWLKRWTPHNIVIGGAAGAFPPMIGWTAATGGLSFEPIVLFLIIFFWTPPHFWALSLVRVDDYARARVPMLPVVAGWRRRAGKSSSTRSCWSRSALRPGSWAMRMRSMAWSRSLPASRWWRWPGAYAASAKASAPIRRRSSCLASRSSICSCCSPSFWSRAVWSATGREGAGDDMDEKDEGIVLTEAQKRSRRSRSIAIALVLGALVILFYIVTLVKGPGVLNRPL